MAHVAKEMGVSRVCAHRWLKRYGEHGWAGRATDHRYEGDTAGELLHIDVKKLGGIANGGGWRIHGRSEAVTARGIGYDYVHATTAPSEDHHPSADVTNLLAEYI